MDNHIITHAGANGKPAAIDPRSPCPHPPGSEMKIRWLQARASVHLPLFLPGDVASRRGRRRGLRILLGITS